ncbi:putative 2-aminoethylphosphonate ABC transporter substrate-binding protein [Radicibacter daui]|uniref:putative 2-aminoethylphosphonate ABC transporter substrate-binding protein n=1 Tax=Radicibacter daui TaxID=3064829 RepID=UPI00404693FA
MSRKLAAAAFGAVALLGATAAHAAEELTVYTAFEADDLARYKAAFEAANPGITINWVRDSTGVVTAKLLAEKDNPQADVVWGLAATSLLLMKSEGMLEAYKPAGADRLDKRFIDSSNPPTWAGFDAWVASVCVNTVEARKLGLPMPTSWADLTKPEYRGHVSMPNPASSGTGFLDVSSWLQMMGEEKGWAYMDALHQNITAYTHSGSKPCKDAARGEVAMGVSFAYRGAQSINDGAPIAIVVPKEGVGWDMEAAAIVKGTDHEEAAKKLMDFSVSEGAMKEYNVGYAVLGIPGIAKPVPNYPENISKSMINNDFEWAATNRDRILAEWQRRYDGKSEPKS